MIQAGRNRDLDLIGVLVVVGLCAAVISTNLGTRLNTYDGAISSSAATFTLHGLLPYRDYWILYGPLSGFLLAIPTAILGPSVELSRGVGFVIICVQALVAYRIARVWAARGPAIALAVSAVVMVPATISLDVSAWPMAMTLALAALYLSIGTQRSGLAIGLVLGLTFLCRLDVGIYALLGVLLVRDRRAVLVGFAVIAIPFIAIALATTGADRLIEQLIWYPIVGPRQFRGTPGPEVLFGQPTAALIEIPLLLLPRLAIVLAAARAIWLRSRHEPNRDVLALLGLVLFAALCQLQTQGRADIEHFAQASTPALLLYAVWFPKTRPTLVRFGALAWITVSCMLAGLTANRIHPDTPAYDDTVLAASSWVQSATDPNEPIFVGLTSNRFTIDNPLLIYYLADRAPGVRDTMFNPGVTNTDWGQTRMVGDLERTMTPYLVLDRLAANASEPSNDSRIPGSTILDTYIATNYHTVCDLGSLVIQVRNDLQRTAPPCPAVAR